MRNTAVGPRFGQDPPPSFSAPTPAYTCRQWKRDLRMWQATGSRTWSLAQAQALAGEGAHRQTRKTHPGPPLSDSCAPSGTSKLGVARNLEADETAVRKEHGLLNAHYSGHSRASRGGPEGSSRARGFPRCQFSLASMSTVPCAPRSQWK